MKNINVKIKDEGKADFVMDLLRDLPFVEIEEEMADNYETTDITGGADSLDDLFGIWEKRDITLDSIRKCAWVRGKL